MTLRRSPLLLGATILLGLCGSPRPSSAQTVFERVGVTRDARLEDYFSTARQAAMGNADLAGAWGAEGVLVNPGAAFVAGDGASFAFTRSSDFSPLLAEHVEFTAWGAEARRRRWRIALTARGYSTDLLVRTAFEPTGARIHVARRDLAVGLGFDLTGMVLDPDRWNASVGAALHRITVETSPDEEANDTVDVGATVGRHVTRGWSVWHLRGAVTTTNLTDAQTTSGTRTAPMPRLLRTGVGVDWAWSPASVARTPVRVAVALTYSDDLRGDADAMHGGGEVVLLDLLALRAGHDGVAYGGSTGFGAGLRTPIGENFVFRVDWARQTADTDAGEFDVDAWSAGIEGRL